MRRSCMSGWKPQEPLPTSLTRGKSSCGTGLQRGPPAGQPPAATIPLRSVEGKEERVSMDSRHGTEPGRTGPEPATPQRGGRETEERALRDRARDGQSATGGYGHIAQERPRVNRKGEESALLGHRGHRRVRTGVQGPRTKPYTRRGTTTSPRCTRHSSTTDSHKA